MSPKSPVNLAKKIRRSREQAGLSQGALGRAIGVPASTIMRLERGDIATPDPDKVERIAEALGIDPEELFAEYPSPERLPAMAPYLRAKYGMSNQAVAEAERLFAELSEREEGKGDRRGKRTR